MTIRTAPLRQKLAFIKCKLNLDHNSTIIGDGACIVISITSHPGTGVWEGHSRGYGEAAVAPTQRMGRRRIQRSATERRRLRRRCEEGKGRVSRLPAAGTAVPLNGGEQRAAWRRKPATTTHCGRLVHKDERCSCCLIFFFSFFLRPTVFAIWLEFVMNLCGEVLQPYNLG